MTTSLESFGHGMMSGGDRRVRARVVRAACGIIEPLYACAMIARNGLYARGVFGSHFLGRPTLSVGNITAGGTGKTPVVHWLAERLRDRGLHPAILLRGYRRGDGISDEAAMLQAQLNASDAQAVIVHANPSRVAGAAEVLRRWPGTDMFLLDDGFQHRKARRDFDLLLISAPEPFGYGHVHPRGLLREPRRGLGRADAFVLTRADQVSGEQLRAVEREIRRHNATAPIYRANHALAGFRAGGEERQAVEALRGQRYFAFAGIANAGSLFRQLRGLGGECGGERGFEDHHPYRAQDLRELRQAAERAGAKVLLTTEKDWAKIRSLAIEQNATIPIWRVQLAVRFWQEDEENLLKQMLAALGMRV